MELHNAIMKGYAHWQMRQATNRLLLEDKEGQQRAKAHLKACSPRCWPLLRRVAFRQRTRLAVSVAELLYEMGDVQGLYALLEQNADGYMYAWYGQELRRAIQQVGGDQVRAVLEFALDNIEADESALSNWSLALSVFALHAFKLVSPEVPDRLWQRALTVQKVGFEDLRTVRSSLPIVLPSETRLSLTPPMSDWRVGESVAAVRRVAIDTLLALRRQDAFPFLRDALVHSDPQVQVTAIYGMTRLKDKRAYALLLPIASNVRHPLRRDAQRAIETLGTDLPDDVTLVRASAQEIEASGELLRPVMQENEKDPTTLLRSVNEER